MISYLEGIDTNILSELSNSNAVIFSVGLKIAKCLSLALLSLSKDCFSI